MRTVILIVVVAFIGLFAILNRHALMFPHTLSLGFVTYSNVPLGLILILFALFLTLVFYIWSGAALLRAQASSAKLLREIETLRLNLDTQENSRFTQLQTYLDQQFQNLESQAGKEAFEQLSARVNTLQSDLNVQLAQMDDYLKRKLT